MIRNKTILLVEDNPDDEELTLRALAKNRVASKVIVVRDGVEALDYLFGTGSFAGRDTSILPELIMLDLKLPKLSGLEVLRRVREHERTRFVPVVVLTTSDEERDRLQSYIYHANSYIRKPVDFDQFTEAVNHIGLYWLSLNEPPPPR